jgi:DNA-binding IclR family transcriptional regulator
MATAKNGVLKKKTARAPGNKLTAMSSTLRCLRVLELMAEEPFEFGISEIAELLETPRASAHRLCATLLYAGLVDHDAKAKRYRLAPKALWIGSGYLRHSALYRAAFFPIQHLAKTLPGTVQLGVLSEDTVLFIYSVGGGGAPEAFADVGLRRPLHATASGKLFLADMPAETVQQLMSVQLRRYTAHTKTSLVKIKQELEGVKAKRYAVNDEELLPGYFVLAAPVLDATGRSVAAISVTFTVADLQARGEEALAPVILEAARQTSIQLGYKPRLFGRLDQRSKN